MRCGGCLVAMQTICADEVVGGRGWGAAQLGPADAPVQLLLLCAAAAARRSVRGVVRVVDWGGVEGAVRGVVRADVRSQEGRGEGCA